MVMGDDLSSKRRGFESQCHIPDGPFFILICCKNCIVCLKRPKINEKEAGFSPFLKKCLCVNCHKTGISSLHIGKIFQSFWRSKQFLFSCGAPLHFAASAELLLHLVCFVEH